METGVVFKCNGRQLLGILHVPEAAKRLGVVIVVGGPTYRIGSHRQFVLLSRRLAAQGYAGIRFDYRGMGDSEGDERSFQEIQEDIRAAIDCLRAHVPDVQAVVLWGLCDAATAICLSLARLEKVSGVTMLNPWVRSEQTLARSYIRSYYAKRLLSAANWRRLFNARIDLRNSARDFLAVLRVVFWPSATKRVEVSLAQRLLSGLGGFSGSVLIILSGNDLTAAEFREAMRGSKEWQQITAEETLTLRELQTANHTFSKREWRGRVEEWTIEWLDGLCGTS